jgi:DNA polymerase-3 subunit delta
LKLTLAGAQAIIDRMGDDLSFLTGELEKLSLYPGPGATLGPKEIAGLVSLGPTAVIYELGAPMATQKVDEVAAILLDLEEKAQAFPLMATVANHFLRIYRFKVDLETANPESLSGPRPMGFKPLYFQSLLAQAKLWDWRRLAQAIDKIYRAQRAMVTVSTPQSLILEELAMSLATSLAKAEGRP